MLTVFNVDCLTILPDFAEESFAHCRLSTSSLSDPNSTHHPEKNNTFCSYALGFLALGWKVSTSHWPGELCFRAQVHMGSRQVCLHRDRQLRGLLQSAEETAIAANYGNYCTRSVSPISEAGLMKA